MVFRFHESRIARLRITVRFPCEPVTELHRIWRRSREVQTVIGGMQGAMVL